MNRVLIIDDEEKLRTLLARIISLEGYEVLQAGDCKSGLKRLEQEDIDAVLCDVKLPDGNGVELTGKIKEMYPAIEVILLTAYGNIADGVQAIKNGAFDYITKGDDNHKIIPLLNKAIEKTKLQFRIRSLEKKVFDKFSFSNILGSSKEIVAAKELAAKVAKTNTTVLLLGETGTGKEVFAQSIHEASNRKGKPFIAVNCSALGKELLESELFGYKTGGFTGALKDKRGLLEEANEGSIFLDEIGEMNIDLQAKLLRVLETGEFYKVGDPKPTKVDVRVIAATNVDLQEASKNGLFRLDLFYRLSVFSIRLPSLNERNDDIEVFANHFVKVFADKMNKRVPAISNEFLKAIKGHRWTGNIRELKNVIERAVILSDNTLHPSSLPFDFGTDNNKTFIFDLAEAEKLQIQRVLQHTGGNKAEAARLLNIALATLYRKLKEYDLD